MAAGSWVSRPSPRSDSAGCGSGTWCGEAAIVQPLVAALAFALLGGLGGLIIGEAWRTDERAWHDRGWAAAAVLSHGVVIAGFGFLAMNAMYDGSGNGSAFLLLVPLVVVAVLFRRWFRGGRAGLILVDLIIAGLGVLGAFVTGFGTISVAGTSSPFELENLGVMIATVASIVALVTACYPMRRPDGSTADGAVAGRRERLTGRRAGSVLGGQPVDVEHDVAGPHAHEDRLDAIRAHAALAVDGMPRHDDERSRRGLLPHDLAVDPGVEPRRAADHVDVGLVLAVVVPAGQDAWLGVERPEPEAVLGEGLQAMHPGRGGPIGRSTPFGRQDADVPAPVHLPATPRGACT